MTRVAVRKEPAPGDTAAGPRESLVDRARRVRARAAELDSHAVADALRTAGARAWWTRPLLYLGYTLDALVSAVLLLLTTARLVLLELVPAVWIGAITWDWRTHVSGELPLPAVYGWVAVLVVGLVLAANLAAYWCNATLAFAFLQGSSPDVRAAFEQARQHTRVINTWALSVGALHAFVSVVLSRTSVGWFGLGISVVAVVQLYALVALPVALAGLRRRGVPAKRRLSNAAVSAVISLVAFTPGFVLNRLGLLVMALGLPWVGIAVLVVSTVVQVAATSSAHAVVLATKVQTAESAEQG